MRGCDRCQRRFRQDFANAMVGRDQAGPLPGIPKRDFLKPDTIAVRRRTDVEVSRHDNSRIEAEMPILSAACPAPD